MGGSEYEDAKAWRSRDLWSRPLVADGNVARQLMVPAAEFATVSGVEGAMQVSNRYGTWPASTADRSISADGLWLKLPVGSKIGDRVRGAVWSHPVSLQRRATDEVLDTYRGALRLEEPAENETGLRSPQLGAIHAVLGYWTTKRTEPATVVMPTGTGKTETMLGLLVAARPRRLLVIVPSDALREQIAGKFDRLGVLQELGIIAATALRPVVGRVGHGFSAENEAIAFAQACNVVVGTPAALHASTSAVRETFLSQFSHLFVDEAHHVAASTWTDIRAAFANKPVVQFTATPFREDGRHLQGRVIYSFPLREAQAQGYFSKIDFKSVVDFEKPDAALAREAVSRLRADLEAGKDHVLMARVESIPRAKAILAVYQEAAPDLIPIVIYSQLNAKTRKVAVEALTARTSRVVVCVDMLGEGFDLPALKVAAVHDAHKSLGVTLQFIGRFARTSSDDTFGDAAMFVARTELEPDPRLRSLYAEDADWNVILRDISEAAVDEQQEISDFEAGFSSLPEEVALRSLLPKMSTVVYRAPSSEWDTDAILKYFGEPSLHTKPIGLNTQAGVAWCVVERRTPVRWGDLKTLDEVSYELYVLYFDSARKLLYVNNSANDGVFEELAEAVLGNGAVRFNGTLVYRVMGDVQRLVPTNVGVLDARSQFRRFSMHVGSDVTESFTAAEAGTKTQTNISGSGFRDGERVNISASQKGRIWSHSTATSLKQWCDWCDAIGTKLLDETVTIEHVIGNFILPEPLKDRPEGVLLGVEWPWQLHAQNAESKRLKYDDKTIEAVYCDLIPDTSSSTGPFKFTISNRAWNVAYEAAVSPDGDVSYTCATTEEIQVIRPRSELPLSTWLNQNGLVFLLDDDRMVEGGLLYRPKWDHAPYDSGNLVVVDWAGTDIKVESQTDKKLDNSIQRRVIRDILSEDHGWDVVIDDDGPGEMADVVAMRLDDEGLLVRLIHCKYSSGPTPGARVADLYEVCGQAEKSVAWRRSDLSPFFKQLARRAQAKHQRTGTSPFEVGDAAGLLQLQAKAQVHRRRMEIVIVQPGLSASQMSQQQADLLASVETYVKTTINAPLTIWCSA
ncbi:DEAD/DEAH box helicase [Arthrobacter sp. KNU40]|uniref:DEAD/DEAH box helicase n=1 Tax=Arthrobacter sp. KNU40 TaxID=3447965 RepID=UPI003F618262